MIRITGNVSYEHSFTARFVFSFGEVDLSVAFFDNVVYVVLPDNMNMLWRIVADDEDLLTFLQTLKAGITKLQFVLRFGTKVVRREGFTGVDLTNIQISVDSVTPAERTASPYDLPISSR